MNQTQSPIDVFISYKSADIALAEELFQFLKSRGLSVFLSSESLPALGNADYRKAIDHALDQCTHMVVISSKIDYLSSSWVEAEWGFYINEKRAGRKKGNILTVVTNDIAIEDLPASLRYFQVIFFQKDNFEQIASYVGRDYQDPAYKPKRKSLLKSKWFLPAISAVVLIAVLMYIFNESSKPFDASISLVPDQLSNINPSYPAFKDGELSLYFDDKEEKQRIVAGQPVYFQQIPDTYKGKKIHARLNAQNWRLLNDSFVIDKTPIRLSMIPDGKMGLIFGNVKDMNGNDIEGCQIRIGADTSVLSNSSGDFKISLPFSMQREQYILFVSKEKFQSQKLDYFAGSGNIDIRLKK